MIMRVSIIIMVSLVVWNYRYEIEINLFAYVEEFVQYEPDITQQAGRVQKIKFQRRTIGELENVAAH
jgi:hypothetical protein